jgi:hypothetical protein
LLIVLGNEDTFFQETVHRQSGLPQIDPKAKLLLCLKVLAFGVLPMAFLDFFQMGERAALDALGKFRKIVTASEILRSLYLRKMTRADAKRVSDMHFDRYGVEGLVGSLDCMHAYWKNCPMEWRGQFKGKEKWPSLVLEAVADANLFIWHAAFGYPGSLNDLNILEQSPLHKDMLDGTFHENVDFDFTINEQKFHRLYYLTDGIYPNCSPSV